jgi:hypothetical protein
MFLQKVQDLRENSMLGFLDTVERLARLVGGRADLL